LDEDDEDDEDVEYRLCRMTATTPATSSIEIPPDLDPFLVDGPRIQRQRLVQLSSSQRATLVLTVACCSGRPSSR
jgi:hypothetical protein